MQSATAAIIGTMTFSQTVSNTLPAVGHATKMSNFILFSYIFTFAVLICQVRSIRRNLLNSLNSVPFCLGIYSIYLLYRIRIKERP